MPADAGVPVADEIAGLHARFQAAIAGRDIASVTQSAPHLVDAYFQAGNVVGACEVYKALASVSPETSLGPDRLARLAKELEQSLGDMQLAMTAWRTLALAHPEHPRAPNALWRCALICQKVGNVAWEASACQAILARYPMSEVAALATARLKKLDPSHS
jgi:TolA-binding protein